MVISSFTPCLCVSPERLLQDLAAFLSFPLASGNCGQPFLSHLLLIFSCLDCFRLDSLPLFGDLSLTSFSFLLCPVLCVHGLSESTSVSLYTYVLTGLLFLWYVVCDNGTTVRLPVGFSMNVKKTATTTTALGVQQHSPDPCGSNTFPTTAVIASDCQRTPIRGRRSLSVRHLRLSVYLWGGPAVDCSWFGDGLSQTAAHLSKVSPLKEMSEKIHNPFHEIPRKRREVLYVSVATHCIVLAPSGCGRLVIKLNRTCGVKVYVRCEAGSFVISLSSYDSSPEEAGRRGYGQTGFNKYVQDDDDRDSSSFVVALRKGIVGGSFFPLFFNDLRKHIVYLQYCR